MPGTQGYAGDALIPFKVIQLRSIRSVLTTGFLVLGFFLAGCNAGKDTADNDTDKPATEDISTQFRNCSEKHARPVHASIFVSAQGSDSWEGTSIRPFRTIARAQASVRALNRDMTGDIVVAVRAGDYFLAEPLSFTEADSGANGYQVIYKNADAVGSARFIGGMRLSGWLRYSGSIFQAAVPPGLVVTTLYEDGVRAEEARFPNRASPASLSTSRSPYLMSANAAASSVFLTYNPGDLPALAGDLAALKIFIWSGHDWYTDVVPVTDHNPSTRQLTLAQETRYPIVAGSRYFFQGELSLLDAPGEFVHDSKNGILYYWPRNGDIHQREIIVPTLRTVLSVQGSSPDTPVHDLRFEGIRFEASKFAGWYRFGWPNAGQSGELHLISAFDRQIEMVANRLGLITFENTERVDLMYSHVKNSGFGGIYLRFSNQHNCIYGNLIEHVGINGITLQGRYPGEGNVLHHNVLSNNLIRYVGEMAGNAAGVDVSNSGFNEISYSRIHDSPRYAVLWHVGASLPGRLSYVHGNIFKYLRISGVGQDSGDTGAVYSFGLANDSHPRTNTVDQVIVTNVHADPSMADIPPNGVFVDNDSSTQIFSNIKVEGTAGPWYRQNASPAQIFRNVNWQNGFDIHALDDAQINLRADFPAVYLE